MKLYYRMEAIYFKFSLKKKNELLGIMLQCFEKMKYSRNLNFNIKI